MSNSCKGSIDIKKIEILALISNLWIVTPNKEYVGISINGLNRIKPKAFLTLPSDTVLRSKMS